MTLDELVDRISSIIGSRVLVGIDGRDGVGKTTLARELAKLLGANLVSLDDYLNKNQGVFLDALRYDEVTEAILGAASRIVLIEGVCLRAAVERCGLDPQLHVYVRRLAQDGRWEDEEQCCPDDAEELKERELRERNDFSIVFGGEAWNDLGVHGELIDYHHRHQPYQNADIVFDIRERGIRAD